MRHVLDRLDLDRQGAAHRGLRIEVRVADHDVADAGVLEAEQELAEIGRAVTQPEAGPGDDLLGRVPARVQLGRPVHAELAVEVEARARDQHQLRPPAHQPLVLGIDAEPLARSVLGQARRLQSLGRAIEAGGDQVRGGDKAVGHQRGGGQPLVGDLVVVELAAILLIEEELVVEDRVAQGGGHARAVARLVGGRRGAGRRLGQVAPIEDGEAGGVHAAQILAQVVAAQRDAPGTALGGHPHRPVAGPLGAPLGAGAWPRRGPSRPSAACRPPRARPAASRPPCAAPPPSRWRRCDRASRRWRWPRR